LTTTTTDLSQQGEPRTVRLDGDLVITLEERARQDNVTLSSLVNKAVKKSIEWDHNAEKFGFTSVSGTTLRKLFERLSDEDARKLGEDRGQNELPEFITLWFKKVDFETAIKALELLGSYGRAFRFDYSQDGMTHTIILKHDRGLNASAYYAEALKSLFKSLGLHVETIESDLQVTAEITS
jgi:hypothetical protein